MNIRIELNEYITLNIATIGLPYSLHLLQIMQIDAVLVLDVDRIVMVRNRRNFSADLVADTQTRANSSRFE